MLHLSFDNITGVDVLTLPCCILDFIRVNITKLHRDVLLQ